MGTMVSPALLRSTGKNRQKCWRSLRADSRKGDGALVWFDVETGQGNRRYPASYSRQLLQLGWRIILKPEEHRKCL